MVENFLSQKLRNLAQSVLLIGFMAVLLGYLAWVIGGASLAIFAFALVVLSYGLAPAVSPGLILRLYRGRELGPRSAPELYAILRELARRAELEQVPRLYYVPSNVMNAFAVGERDNAVITVSDGLLRRLSLAEIAGVLAHEVSHIRNRDIRVMGFADLIERLTRLLSLIGQFLLLLNLPLLLLTDYSVSWVTIGVLIFAPTVTALGQLALSRTREYDADLEAASLLGDPGPLAAALAKMERVQGRIIEQFLGPGQRLPDPSLLRSHPPTGERIRRLLELRGRERLPRGGYPLLPLAPSRRHGVTVAPDPLAPRWHVTGNWF